MADDIIRRLRFVRVSRYELLLVLENGLADISEMIDVASETLCRIGFEEQDHPS